MAKGRKKEGFKYCRRLLKWLQYKAYAATKTRYKANGALVYQAKKEMVNL